MKIAVLSAGPSLCCHWRDSMRKHYDTVIGVNIASWLFAVDIAACLDQVVINEWPLASITPKAWITGNRIRTPEGSERIKAPIYGQRKCAYTFPCALSVASELAEGGQVDVYGFDCGFNQLDAAGRQGNRTVKRWRQELPWVKQVWQPHWKNYGACPTPIIEWLAGRATESEAMKHLPL